MTTTLNSRRPVNAAESVSYDANAIAVTQETTLAVTTAADAGYAVEAEMSANLTLWTRVASAIIASAVLSVASPALADIVVLTGVDNTGTENVVLDGGPLDNLVSGTGGVTGGRLTFTGVEELTVDTVTNRLLAGDGAFSIVTIAATDATNLLTGLVINLNALADGNVTIKVKEAHGFDFQDTFFVDGNGENPFTLTAINGQRIVSVELSGTTFTDVRQVRAAFEGFPPTLTIPEPAVWGLLIGGFAATGMALRRERRFSHAR
jgi:hypothetical protein